MSETKKLSDEQLAALKAPLPAGAVGQHPTKTFLSTIKAIYVVERLNEVFGLGGWEVMNRHVVSRLVPRFKNGEKVSESEMVVIHATFKSPQYGIYVEAFGGNDNDDLGDAYKGACTDALTKIGSYLYIGMDVFKGLTDNAPQGKREASKPLPPFAAPKKGTSAPAKAVSGDILTCSIEAINKKPTKNGGEMWGFKTEHGWLNTFDPEIGNNVRKGETVNFQIAEKNGYKNIVALVHDEPLPPEPFLADDSDVPF